MLIFAEKSEKGSTSNLSTKVGAAARALEAAVADLLAEAARLNDGSAVLQKEEVAESGRFKAERSC